MKQIVYALIATPLVFLSCNSQKNAAIESGISAIDLQGHRGSRGLMPENTIPAMRVAIDHGVTTVELDVVISQDKQVVVSHDPHFNDVITTTPGGKHITKKEAEDLLLYKMNYDEIKKYDVGSKPHPGFPKQQKIKTYKPLLSELIDSVEAYAKQKGRSIRYNIEIKSKATTDGSHHPDTKTFSELVLAVITKKKILSKTTIQSFDLRPLQYLHTAHPRVTLSYLVERSNESLQAQLNKLGFQPNTYSPYYTNVTKDVVNECHQKGIKILPWTVNDVDEMQKLVAMAVDGIISDYPDLFAQLKTKK